MMMRAVAMLSLAAFSVQAANIVVSWESNGLLRAEGMEPGTTGIVEAVSHLGGTFTNGAGFFAAEYSADSNGVISVALPMFFRVAGTPADPCRPANRSPPDASSPGQFLRPGPGMAGDLPGLSHRPQQPRVRLRRSLGPHPGILAALGIPPDADLVPPDDRGFGPGQAVHGQGTGSPGYLVEQDRGRAQRRSGAGRYE